MRTVTWLAITASLIAVAAVTFIACANVRVLRYQRFTINDVQNLPVATACLVLGTSQHLSDERENLFYKYRIAAAVQAYTAGKCTRIVVSGDNRHTNYNEPEKMKRSLVELGVPVAAIYRDYGGDRTLDSVIRFKRVFGQSSGIVISQQFHNARAIYIGRANGIDLVGFNAQDVDAYNGFRTKLREIFSRARAVIDVELLNSQPSHLGDPIPLSRQRPAQDPSTASSLLL